MDRPVTGIAAALFAVLCATAAPAAANGCNSVCSLGVTGGKDVVTRSYPICFYNKRPSADEIEGLEVGLRSFIAPYMPGGMFQTGVSPDSRWLSLKGAQAGHTALKKVWPRVGCYGNYVSQSQYVLYRRCVLYLEAFLAQPNYAFGGALSDGDQISGQLFCDGL